MLEELKKIRLRRFQDGFSLFELIITLSILAIVILGTIPLAQNAVKRQKELKLRETLRQVRAAIDEFKRDTMGACQGLSSGQGQPGRPNYAFSAPTDPRSRVVIDECEIFDTLNLDKYPPTLETLSSGVGVRERGMSVVASSGIRDGTTQATEINQLEEITKIYLRHVPVDPMTGESDWKLRSSYQPADDEEWDNVNVFDLRSASDETALDGTKYSDW